MPVAVMPVEKPGRVVRLLKRDDAEGKDDAVVAVDVAGGMAEAGEEMPPGSGVVCSSKRDSAEFAGMRWFAFGNELLNKDERPLVIPEPDPPCLDGASGWPCKPSIGPDELVFWMDSRMAATRDDMLPLFVTDSGSVTLVVVDVDDIKGSEVLVIDVPRSVVEAGIIGVYNRLAVPAGGSPSEITLESVKDEADGAAAVCGGGDGGATDADTCIVGVDVCSDESGGTVSPGGWCNGSLSVVECVVVSAWRGDGTCGTCEDNNGGAEDKGGEICADDDGNECGGSEEVRKE